MKEPVIPHNAYIFVGDGCKALFLRNEGDEKFANFVVERVFADDNPATRDQGTDEPGRAFAAAHSVMRSAVEPTDWHRIEERKFVDSVAVALEKLVRESDVPALAIVAPPRALAELRHALHPDVKARVVIEIAKELTHHPLFDIERHVLAELKSA